MWKEEKGLENIVKLGSAYGQCRYRAKVSWSLNLQWSRSIMTIKHLTKVVHFKLDLSYMFDAWFLLLRFLRNIDIK